MEDRAWSGIILPLSDGATIGLLPMDVFPEDFFQVDNQGARPQGLSHAG